jgi:hypothetical protein
MKYQTKPIEVDAVQWFKNGDDPRVVDGEIFTYLAGWIPIEPSNWIVYYPSTDLTDIYSDKGFRELFEKQEEKPFKKGDKVIPVSKSIGVPLEESDWIEAVKYKSPYLFVTNVFDSGIVWCAMCMDAICKDQFLLNDLIPYREEK